MAMEEALSVGEYTQDGTVDLKGNPVLRSKGGGWTACSFIVVYEVFERMAYCGISSNLIVYLTRMLHQGTVTASNNVTNWTGAIWMTPILGAYVADAHLGRYWTFVTASAIYLSGGGGATTNQRNERPHCVGCSVEEKCPKVRSHTKLLPHQLDLYPASERAFVEFLVSGFFTH
ncbi:unnamed protein product [Ilex paraguariensis]|uniref:Uncharacterized protein n=1 Tax=Ilex paraguariensis TaxID=185542 RepID=A0ABC8R7J8_9AQUA